MGTTLKLAGTIRDSVVDGPGVRYAVYVQGCPHRCPHCHNPETHDFGGGFEADAGKLAEEIIASGVKGITFSGGEPFCQAGALAEVARLVMARRKVSVVAYSGYTFEQLLEMAKEDKGVDALLTVADYLVDGRYEHGQRNLSLLYRGSSNQRIIDVTAYPNVKRINVVDKMDE